MSINNNSSQGENLPQDLKQKKAENYDFEDSKHSAFEEHSLKSNKPPSSFKSKYENPNHHSELHGHT